MARLTLYSYRNQLFPRSRGGEAPSERQFTATWAVRSSRRTPRQTAQLKINPMGPARKLREIMNTRRPAFRMAQQVARLANVRTPLPAASIRAVSTHLWPTARSGSLLTISRRMHGGQLERARGAKLSRW